MEIQQSSLYAEYIKRLGWTVETVGHTYLYIRPFPIIGGIAKIQRSRTLPAPRLLVPVLQKYRIRSLAVEPDHTFPQQALTSWAATMRRHVRLHTDYFLPTKTIRVPLTGNTDTIFLRLTEAKRRGVRRAKKLGVTISATPDIRAFIRVKNASAGFLGWITTHGLDRLWGVSRPGHADTLLAYAPSGNRVGGILLLYHRRLAYYWVAGASQEGKHLFAPTLLVWEALQRAKAHGATQLDFVGVWDERMPDNNTEWKGFTKFKEGFGGRPVYYPYIRA